MYGDKIIKKWKRVYAVKESIVETGIAEISSVKYQDPPQCFGERKGSPIFFRSCF